MAPVCTLDDLDLTSLQGVRVFVRVDFNVPIDENGTVTDDTRLTEALPTLQELRQAGARLILASHRGRPKGKPNPELSLAPVAKRLGELLGAPVPFATDCVGPAAEELAGSLGDGDVGLLENLRFHAGEKANDEDFGDALASLADVFVSDAFGSAHRAHASVVGVPQRLARKAAGRLMVREVEALGHLLGEPKRPFAAILGGAKISGKIDTLDNLLERLDVLLVGGGMANTFLAAQGHDLANSLVEADRVELAASILHRAQEAETQVLLPLDVVVTDDLSNPQRIETVAVEAIPAGTAAVDIGPATREVFGTALSQVATVFWNGPQGVFEVPPFDAGTVAVAQAFAASSAYKVIGGGETVAAVHRAGAAESVNHISTGGGASLELLAGKTLPGVEILEVKS
ncbi:MAG: phosphoglycerate kinase [Acidobacteriota bacterium]